MSFTDALWWPSGLQVTFWFFLFMLNCHVNNLKDLINFVKTCSNWSGGYGT